MHNTDLLGASSWRLVIHSHLSIFCFEVECKVKINRHQTLECMSIIMYFLKQSLAQAKCVDWCCVGEKMTPDCFLVFRYHKWNERSKSEYNLNKFMEEVMCDWILSLMQTVCIQEDDCYDVITCPLHYSHWKSLDDVKISIHGNYPFFFL